MIRELATTPTQMDGGERCVTAWKLWYCYRCGLQFSMRTHERPSLCPRCKTEYEGVEHGE